MKEKGKKLLWTGVVWIAVFGVWTMLIQTIDVKPVGQNGTDVGFAWWNVMFHRWTGVHMTIYTITDWLGLIPLFVCVLFGVVGLVQFVERKRIVRVDYDIIFLGIYYVVVIAEYLVFEMMPVNYRPVLINERMEASYPSSTTLLVISVMPTLIFQVNRRFVNPVWKKVICVIAVIFSVFMVIGRLVSGVHWFTDIIGSVMISIGGFCIYKAVVLLCCKEEN